LSENRLKEVRLCLSDSILKQPYLLQTLKKTLMELLVLSLQIIFCRARVPENEFNNDVT